MLTRLRRRFHAAVLPVSDTPALSSDGLHHPLPGTVLLEHPERKALMEQIWQRTAVSREQFERLYQTPLQRYAGLVQAFPVSPDGPYRYAGGMLDHALRRVCYALRLRQACLLPIGAPPEEQAAQAEAWTAGVAYASLLQDLGKLVVDLCVEQDDGSLWYPWQGPLRRPYCYHYLPEQPYRLHSAATALMYSHVLDADLLAWLRGYETLWTNLLFMISGQEAQAGILGDLTFQASQAVMDQAAC
ncbi:TraI domain-containing protein [Pseudomonas oryzihabitans]|uniref:TraI domain-containing protein n=1 Tax=Pseudomonas oryzihabitans TaxID=47885 RepID=UPI003EB6BAD0